jgi:hypothetical protein
MRESREERFRLALERIRAYMTPAQLRRSSWRSYGLKYDEALEMAYENVLGEARAALRGVRRSRPKAPQSVLLPKSTDSTIGGPK